MGKNREDKKTTIKYIKKEITYLTESPFKSELIEDEDIKPDLNSLILTETEIHQTKNLENKNQHTDSVSSILRNFRFQPDYNLQATIRHKSLDEKSGQFYICNCSQDRRSNSTADIFQKTDLDRLMSDTESCSDVEDFVYHPPTCVKFFCDTCGNGYRTKKGLAWHLQVHQMKCEVCDRRFVSRLLYKEHMRGHLMKVYVCHLCEREFAHKVMLLDHLDAHIEDEVYENVFGLERDYKIVPRQMYYPVGFEVNHF